ncbi:MAG: LPS assembly protein LptD [Methylococcaceae bacterium]|nr:LPS assembly protein LptD [Methylococcaceae bacterium]
MVYIVARIFLIFFSTALWQISAVRADEFGWDCKRNRANGQWQCVNPEQPMSKPKVQQVVEEQEKGWFSDTYSSAQEQLFKRLQQQFKQDPWAMCSLKLGQPTFMVDKQLRELAPINVSADQSEIFDQKMTNFSGDIDLERADQRVLADEADYNRNSGVLDLYGDVIYTDGGMALYGSSVRMNLNEDKSLLRDVSYILPASPIRGSADVVYRDSPTFSRFSDVTYTACEPGNQDWILHASKMKVNDDDGTASIKHGWLEFKQVPVMYIPYGSFPTDDRRKTGLLTPTVGYSQRTGADMALPFYWNVAPNYDLTLTPRYMSSRGFMMGTDFRYLWTDSEGDIKVEMMPEDTQTKDLRWGGSFQHKTQLTKDVSFDWDANYVSDSAYFNDLDGSLGMSHRSRYLESDANIAYTLPWMTLTAKAENYQNIVPNQDDKLLPYRRLPQIKLDMVKDFNELPIALALDSEYVIFQRHFPDGQTEGQRLNLKPSISFPFIYDSGFITPKVALQHSQYWLGGDAPLASTNASKTLPFVSVDSGLFFERDFESLTHTIEPRLFYLYVPYTEQSDMPNFDTSLYDFNSGQLFRDNEFNGPDKTQNTNQITTALTTRLIDDGKERLNLTVGQIFYFEDRKVNLAGDAVHSELLSNLITELSSEITDEIRFSSGMQWSYKEKAIGRGNTDLSYHGLNNNTIFNVGYRYRLEQVDQVQPAQNQILASTIIPIYDGWSVIGLYRYSFFDHKTLEYFYGIEKDSCCWRFRVVARQFTLSTATAAATGVDAKPQNSIYFQFELKGLTSLGDNLEDFLLENISGYRKPNY